MHIMHNIHEYQINVYIYKLIFKLDEEKQINMYVLYMYSL